MMPTILVSKKILLINDNIPNPQSSIFFTLFFALSAYKGKKYLNVISLLCFATAAVSCGRNSLRACIGLYEMSRSFSPSTLMPGYV